MNKLIFLLVILIDSCLNAAIGCMQIINSSSCCSSYEYVACSCPCNRYDRSFNRGKCSVCEHYGTERLNI